jgi:hypothetical protein
MKYDETIIFRLTKQDKQLIQVNAEKLQLTTGAYIRTIIMKTL